MIKIKKNKLIYFIVFIMITSSFVILFNYSPNNYNNYATNNVTYNNYLFGYKQGLIDYSSNNITLHNVYYNYSSRIASVFLPANNFSGGYYMDNSNHLIKIWFNNMTTKVLATVPSINYQYFTTQPSMNYGIMPYYNSADILTHISFYGEQGTKPWGLFWDYNVINGTISQFGMSVGFTNIKNSNFQLNYIGNGIVTEMFEGGSGSSVMYGFNMYSNTSLFTNFALIGFEANNMFWFPNWHIFLNFPTPNTITNSTVQVIYYNFATNTPTTNQTITFNSTAHNGWNQPIVYNNQIMIDGDATPYYFTYSNGILHYNYYGTNVRKSVGSYYIAMYTAFGYIPQYTTTGWTSSGIVNYHGATASLAYNPFNNLSVNSTSEFPSFNFINSYSYSDGSSGDYWNGQSNYAPSSYNLHNATDYIYFPLWYNGLLGSLSIVYMWKSQLNQYYTYSNNNNYNINISESGLPVGTNWIITFNGTQHSTTLNNFNLSELNGTYSFSVSSINGYTVSYPSSITVSGSSQTINVVFHKIATYKVELLESGLPSGTQWNYTFNSNNQVLGNNSYNYSLSNGSYSIYVGSISGYSLHYANPVVVNGHNVIEYINYSLIPTYSVIIKESGLATNTKWYALINNIQYSSTTAYINLSGLTNSTYTLAINNIAGYLLNSYPSSFIINGKNAYINITFTSDNKLSSINVIAKDVKDISSIVWSVVFNETTYNSQNSNTIVIPSLQNGTYSFKVNSISGYKINSYPSSITIAGKNITENITFNQTFILHIEESGYNQEWFINLNGTQYSSTNSYINVSGLVNYTYSFSVPQVVGYTVSSYPHSVLINGNNYYINITFVFQIFPNGKYEIVFVMTGLPKNTNWTVVINGIQHFSNGSKYINITLTNGTYYPDFLLPNNYQLTNSPPTLIVNGQAEYYSVYANYSFNWYNYTPEFAIVLLFIGVLLIPAVVKRRG